MTKLFNLFNFQDIDFWTDPKVIGEYLKKREGENELGLVKDYSYI